MYRNIALAYVLFFTINDIKFHNSRHVKCVSSFSYILYIFLEPRIGLGLGVVTLTNQNLLLWVSKLSSGVFFLINLLLINQNQNNLAQKNNQFNNRMIKLMKHLKHKQFIDKDFILYYIV